MSQNLSNLAAIQVQKEKLDQQCKSFDHAEKNFKTVLKELYEGETDFEVLNCDEIVSPKGESSLEFKLRFPAKGFNTIMKESELSLEKRNFYRQNNNLVLACVIQVKENIEYQTTFLDGEPAKGINQKALIMSLDIYSSLKTGKKAAEYIRQANQELKDAIVHHIGEAKIQSIEEGLIQDRLNFQMDEELIKLLLNREDIFLEDYSEAIPTCMVEKNQEKLQVSKDSFMIRYNKHGEDSFCICHLSDTEMNTLKTMILKEQIARNCRKFSKNNKKQSVLNLKGGFESCS